MEASNQRTARIREKSSSFLPSTFLFTALIRLFRQDLPGRFKKIKPGRNGLSFLMRIMISVRGTTLDLRDKNRMTDPVSERQAYQGPAFFSYGFRPFFLGAALFAGVAIPAWVLMLAELGDASALSGPRDWHVHEMVFGFSPRRDHRLHAHGYPQLDRPLSDQRQRADSPRKLTKPTSRSSRQCANSCNRSQLTGRRKWCVQLEQDERYLPFEGAGVISKWRIELPKEFRQFDYDTISDVVVRVRYTSVDGGRLRSRRPIRCSHTSRTSGN